MLLRLFSILLGLLVSISAIADIRVVDDAGYSVYLEKPAKRIISLAPNVTEMLFAIDCGDCIIGTIKGSDYPTAALKIPRVGDYAHFDVERIIALNPDLIIASDYNPLCLVNALKQFGVPVYVMAPKRLKDVAKDMEQLGYITGNDVQANNDAKLFLNRLYKLRMQYTGKKKVSVFYQIWNHPMMTINGKSIISEVIKICGGENVFENVLVNYPIVSLESVLKKNPRIIITSHTSMLREWQRWKNLTAVNKEQVYFISPDAIQRYSPRILEGATQVCELLDSYRQGV